MCWASHPPTCSLARSLMSETHDCRAAQVFHALFMQTPECMAYYVHILDSFLEDYTVHIDGKPYPTAAAVLAGEAKGVLLQFFVDIGCKFDAYWQQCVPTPHTRACVAACVHACLLLTHVCFRFCTAEQKALPIGVGAWHVFGHKLVRCLVHLACRRARSLMPINACIAQECRLKYSARVMPGAGLINADSPEHMWAFLRPFNPMLKYMSRAAMEDFVCDLVRLRGCGATSCGHLRCHRSRMHACACVGFFSVSADTLQGSPESSEAARDASKRIYEGGGGREGDGRCN